MQYEEVEVNSERWFDLTPLLNEEWKTIILNYNNSELILPNYKVSNYGRVKSYIKYNSHPQVPRILKCSTDKKGYYKNTLNCGGKKIIAFTHRLVANNFVEGKDAINNQVNHKDGNKKNCFFKNLEWCDYYYNRKHALQNELIKFDLKRIAEIDKEGKIINIFHGYKEAKDKTNLPTTNILDRVNNRIKKPRDNRYFKEITKEEELEWISKQ